MIKLSNLKRSLKNATPVTKLTAYKSLILPAIAYDDDLWEPFTQKISKN